VCADGQVRKIVSLLHSLDEVSQPGGLSEKPGLDASRHQSKLVTARLGIASGLFSALRYKHRPSADHSLRVALGCSSWAAMLGLPKDQRDALEIAALLHDVGKIGVPDPVLTKPSSLLPKEAMLMAQHRQIGLAILSNCGVPSSVLDIIRLASTGYAEGGSEQPHCGTSLPVPSRMLAIVDAFDAMTTDHVYRPAKSRERALAELVQFGGTQFDDRLVKKFNRLFACDQNLLAAQVAQRWLHELSQEKMNLPWQIESRNQTSEIELTQPHQLFEEKLINNMHGGVVFVDNQARIFLWSAGIERLTGLTASTAGGHVFTPGLLEMSDDAGRPLSDQQCPVVQSIRRGVQNTQRVGIRGRDGRRINIDLHTIPVRAQAGGLLGATVVLRDASSETSLEQKCRALHVQVTKDAMTQVANRAEFDRMLGTFLEAHLETGRPYSLIMTDIDHFKNINDTYGHLAGDEAIIAVANLLKSMCRAGDFVARYGGEEFGVLCANCCSTTATERANRIRKQLAGQTFSFLNNCSVTASFGVAESQIGDTPQTILRRADRALLQAKNQGRNRVM
jgi:diguanylate cyclase (GGDEF)-like protein/putative nucleotidyltransferase with HDIG domain/PAS domain S-box-containing protein